MKDDATKGVGRRAIAGITWTLIGEVISNVTRIVGVACLARLLTRDDFGVVAIAMTIVLFASRFKEIGLGPALVQRKDIADEHISTTWGFSLAIGCALGLIVFLTAAPLAALYGNEAAADPIRALSSLFLIRAMSTTARALCQRELRFRILATINVISYATGTLSSIALAATGHGLWSLVLGYIIEGATEAALILLVKPPRVGPWIHGRPLRELLGFGSGHTIASLANYFATQGDNIVVGRYLGAGMLGIYDRAYVLMRFPAQVFTTVAGTVLFSSFARLQDDPQRLGVVYRRVLFATATLLLPASAGLIVLAPEAIRILLGPKWLEVIFPFQILAGSMMFRTTYKVSGIVARSAGAVAWIAFYQVLYAVAVIGGAALSIGWGIDGVAITTSIAVVLHFINLTRLALKQVPLTWGEVLSAHLDGLMMAALAIGGSWPVATLLRNYVGVVPTVIVATLAGVIPPVIFVIARIKQGSEDWIWLIDRIKTVVRKKTKRRADQ